MNSLLREIFLTLQNEYTDWAGEHGESPAKVKEQVRRGDVSYLGKHA